MYVREHKAYKCA